MKFNVGDEIRIDRSVWSNKIHYFKLLKFDEHEREGWVIDFKIVDPDDPHHGEYRDTRLRYSDSAFQEWYEAGEIQFTNRIELPEELFVL